MVGQINFKVSPESLDLIAKVADRFQEMEEFAGVTRRARRERFGIIMDFCANQNSSTPVDLAALLKADNREFVHDAFGIARHINRETGELMDCFLPRFVKQGAN